MTADGVLIVDKPVGPTSHDVVVAVRRLTGWKKVGHTGTLDPMASGVLALVVGRATRLAQFFSAADKVYEAEIRLGWATDTYDASGAPAGAGRPAQDAASPTRWEEVNLDALLAPLCGIGLQQPPPFSAKKIEGVRAYALARAGTEVAPKPVPVTLHEVAVLSSHGDRLRVRVHCSAGFYVRSFAHALGLAAGPGAHLTALRRTRSGEFDLAAAVPFEKLESVAGGSCPGLAPLDAVLGSLPSVVVTPEGALRTRHGSDLRPCDIERGSCPAAGGRVRVVSEEGALLAIAEAIGQSSILHPAVVVV